MVSRRDLCGSSWCMIYRGLLGGAGGEYLVRRSTKKLMNHKQRRLVGSKEQDTARTILGWVQTNVPLSETLNVFRTIARY